MVGDEQPACLGVGVGLGGGRGRKLALILTPTLTLSPTVPPKGARDLREIDVARDSDVDHVVDLARVRD